MGLLTTFKHGWHVEIRGGQIWARRPNSPEANILPPNRKLWLPIAKEIALLLGIELYIFTSYKVTARDNRDKDQLTLLFQSITTGETFSCYFNVTARYKRGTKSHKTGSALPNGQFHTTQTGKLAKLISRLNLTPPRYKSEGYRIIKQLKKRLYTGETTLAQRQQPSPKTCTTYEPRIEADSINSLDLTAQQIMALVGMNQYGLGGNLGKIRGHGGESLGNKVGESIAMTASPTRLVSDRNRTKSKPQTISNQQQPSIPYPQHQTTDEWLADYISSPPHPRFNEPT